MTKTFLSHLKSTVSFFFFFFCCLKVGLTEIKEQSCVRSFTRSRRNNFTTANKTLSMGIHLIVALINVSTVRTDCDSLDGKPIPINFD